MIRVMMVPAACLALTAAAAAAVGPRPAPVQAASAGAVRVPGGLWLRGVEPEATSSIQPASARPSCPPGRRVGTGAGFCLLN